MHPGPDVLANDLYSQAADHVYQYYPKKEQGRRHFTDLVAWQQAAVALEAGALGNNQRFGTNKSDLASRAAAAPAVLEGLKPNAEVFAQLRKDSGRKYSRFPINYNTENPTLTQLPHLSYLKQTCQRLELQACAELAVGQSDAALADVKLILALADSVKTEPVLISFLVRISCVQVAIQPVWEGLAEHGWSDAQLQEIQARFASYDFLSGMDEALKAERAYGNVLCDLLKKKGFGAMFDFGTGGSQAPQINIFNAIGSILPSGWFDMEKLNYNKAFDELMRGTIDTVARRVSPRATAEEALFFDMRMPTPHVILQHRFAASLLLANIGRMPLKAAVPQVEADQVALACALERYRLAEGRFPETLEALAPRFMGQVPNDVITGQPYKYRLTADGRYVLYSVGWNGKDDGGVPGESLFDREKGDWVWEYPGL
jgi:hypothetical protein